MKRTIRSSSTLALAVLIGAGSFTGCSRLNQTERGTIIGATGGAVIGGVIGKQVGSTAAGAIVGAAVGGTAGAVIGRRMDRQAEELSQEVEGATVQRIGEGIAITFDGGLLFPFDSDQLLPRGRTNIAELAESLRRYPDTEVLIVGHTDATGSESYNQGLSLRRANSAANLLTSYGINRSRIRTDGRGEYEPIDTNATEVGRQQNRRVEVAIFASEEMREEIQREYGY